MMDGAAVLYSIFKGDGCSHMECLYCKKESADKEKEQQPSGPGSGQMKI
jgi:histone acetyltransferase (RNA polymerase elongator complex component)